MHIVQRYFSGLHMATKIVHWESWVTCWSLHSVHLLPIGEGTKASSCKITWWARTINNHISHNAYNAPPQPVSFKPNTKWSGAALKSTKPITYNIRSPLQSTSSSPSSFCTLALIACLHNKRKQIKKEQKKHKYMYIYYHICAIFSPLRLCHRPFLHQHQITLFM